jgi:hypothetical protein
LGESRNDGGGAGVRHVGAQVGSQKTEERLAALGAIRRHFAQLGNRLAAQRRTVRGFGFLLG